MRTTIDKKVQLELAKKNVIDKVNDKYMLEITNTTDGYKYRIPSNDIDNIDIPSEYVTEGGFVYIDSINDFISESSEPQYYKWSEVEEKSSKEKRFFVGSLLGIGLLILLLCSAVSLASILAVTIQLPIMIMNTGLSSFYFYILNVFISAIIFCSTLIYPKMANDVYKKYNKKTISKLKKINK